MLPLIFIGLVACVNGKPPDDALLQQHAQIMDSVGFGNLAMDTQRNELETRFGMGKFARIKETHIFPM
jgi:hypothetical protein